MNENNVRERPNYDCFASSSSKSIRGKKAAQLAQICDSTIARGRDVYRFHVPSQRRKQIEHYAELER